MITIYKQSKYSKSAEGKTFYGQKFPLLHKTQTNKAKFFLGKANPLFYFLPHIILQLSCFKLWFITVIVTDSLLHVK